MLHLTALLTAPPRLAAQLAVQALLARSGEVVHRCGRAYEEHAEGLCPQG